MVKKVGPSFLALVLAVGVLSVSLSQAYVRVPTILSAAGLDLPVVPTAATDSPQTKISYYLAYPGILPDHLLYRIKVARDWLWLGLTTNVTRRAELTLLFADKRIGAGRVLIEGNQVALGISTMTKGSKYLERSIVETAKAKQAGEEINQFKSTLLQADLKYQEVVGELQGKLNSEGRVAMEELARFLRVLQTRIEDL